MRLRLFSLSTVLLLQCVLRPVEARSQPSQNIKDILKNLKSECDKPSISNESEWASSGSATENKRLGYIIALKTVGTAAESQVRQDLAVAKSEYRDMLVVTLAAFGDNTSIWQASQLMLKAKPVAVRCCAAHVLRLQKDKRLIGVFKRAFADPFKRRDGGCVQPHPMIYPVRLIASSALFSLGLSLKEIEEIGTWRVLD